MTTESSQNQDFTRKHPSEGMDALEKEAKLPNRLIRQALVAFHTNLTNTN